MSQSLPVRRFTFQTRSVPEALASLAGLYAVKLELTAPCDDCWHRLSSIAVGELAVDHVGNNLSLEAVRSVDWFHVNLLLQEGYSVQAGGLDLRPGAGEACLLPAGRDLVRATRGGVRARVLRLPLARVTEFAARHYDMDTAGFRFVAPAPVSAARNRAFRRVIGYVRRALDGPEPPAGNPLVHATVLETVLATALTTFPHTGMTEAYRPGPGRTAPAAVRRAVAFIDAHAGEPITVVDVATAAGVGVRALQAGFGRHLDTSPMDYLRRVRLEAARQELRAADPTGPDTVASIARRWGFAHLGRFAGRYRQAFGEAPSQTLRM